MKHLLIIISLIFALLPSLQSAILHYSETTSFNHRTKDESLALFQQLADDLGHDLIDDRDGSEFNTLENLQRFDFIIFSNTSGANGLNEVQRENMEQYIAGGGSFLGIHAASDTYRHSTANGNTTGRWDWYAETLTGCSVQNGPNHTPSNFNANIHQIKEGTDITLSLPKVWNKTEEYYYWERGFLSHDFIEILGVESTGDKSYDAARMVAHFRELPGGGHAFYTSLGHAKSNFTSDATFQKLMKNVVVWLLGEG